MMVNHTFSFLPGIGEVIERRLWRAGIRTWEAFLHACGIEGLSPGKKKLYDDMLRHAGSSLESGDPSFFLQRLRPREHWRLWPRFRDQAVALDIETNGLPAGAGGYVTMVGLYDGFDFQALLRGQGLTCEALSARLAPYRYMISFFGSGFDLPFLQRTLGFVWRGLHCDLCFAGKRAGLKGGLKQVERTLGIAREESVAGFDGYDAVRLWHAACSGNNNALQLLIAYNRCDTENLFALADTVYARLRARTGIDGPLTSIQPPSHMATWRPRRP